MRETTRNEVYMPLVNEQARKDYERRFYAANKEKWAARSKAKQTPEGRAHLRALRRARSVTPAEEARRRRNMATYRAKHPEKLKAHMLLNRAVQRGDVVRPDNCERCGETPPLSRDRRSLIHGHHHKGHEYPLSVIWLCPVCHKKEHQSL